VTGSSSSGPDLTDRNNFNAANSGLSFNNFTFTGLDNTYNTSAGLQLLVNSYGVQLGGTSDNHPYDLQVVNTFGSW
jgi:hypothetical protein